MPRIRLATPADVFTLLELDRAATAAHWGPSDYQRIFCPDPPPRMALIAEEHTAIGFLVMRTAGEQWEIENLVVAEPARRRGTGTALVNAALVRARSAGAEAVTLEVRETNHAARSLYERLGFVPSGRRRAYYTNPVEDAILYWVRLLPAAPEKR